MVRKNFFRWRSEAEILSEDVKDIYSFRRFIEEAETNSRNRERGLVLRCALIPGYYYQRNRKSYEAAREYGKHGETIPVEHPRTLYDCSVSRKTFLEFLTESFQKIFKETKFYDNKFIGYHFQPFWGDRTRRVVPFYELFEGFLSYIYFRENSPIEVDDRYPGNKKNSVGAQIVVKVPSREKKERRYKFKMIHVPFHERANNLGIVISLRASAPAVDEFNRPEKELYDIRYKINSPNESQERIVFLSQDIAAYYAISEKQKKESNQIPSIYSPFPWLSEDALLFYLYLKNNCLIADPFERKNNLRHFYPQELSRILSLYFQTRTNNLNTLFLNNFEENRYNELQNEI